MNSINVKNPNHGLGVRSKLFFAFSIIAATTLAAASLGLYSLSNIERSIQNITGDAVPSMTTAMSLSQKTGSLKSVMPLLAISNDERDKDRLSQSLHNQVVQIVDLGSQVGGVVGLEDTTDQLSSQIDDMAQLASNKIRNSVLLENAMAELVTLHSTVDKLLITDVDDLGFNLIIESEDATTSNVDALDLLINTTLVQLNAALNLQSNISKVLLDYNVTALTHSIETLDESRNNFLELESEINKSITDLGDQYIDADSKNLLQNLVSKALSDSGVFAAKRSELDGGIPKESVDSLIASATESLDKVSDSLATTIDSLYFDLVISAETVQETNLTTIPSLMDPGVSDLRLLLEYRASINLLLGLLSEASQVDFIENLEPIRDRYTAVEHAISQSIDELEKQANGHALIADIKRMLTLTKSDDGIFSSRKRVLESESGFVTKLNEANATLDNLLVNVTAQVDAAKFSVSDASDNNLQLISLSRKLLGSFAAASLIITVLLVWLLVSRNILKRLASVVMALRNIADGNLSDKLEVKGNDELSELAQSVDSFREKALENKHLLEVQAKSVEERRLQEEERHRLELERQQNIEAQNKAKLEQAERESAASTALRNDTDALLEVVLAASKGDLSKKITVKGMGPTGQLGTGLEQLINSFKEIMHQISSTANSVAADSDNIAVSNTLLAERTQKQAASLEETSASMQRITEVVENNSENAKKAQTLVSTAHQKTQEVERVVNDTVSAMNEINDSSGKISEIVGVINEIAFQTNLLALNASVEAARAGQQGAGFAVVADEVRTLAARSATAAKEIGALIDDSVKKVDYGVQLVDSSGSTLGELSHAVESVIDIIKQIVVDAKTQTDGIHTVNEATRLLDSMTQKNSEMVDQGVAASDSLACQAIKLKEQISFFNIGSEIHSRPGVKAA